MKAVDKIWSKGAYGNIKEQFVFKIYIFFQSHVCFRQQLSRWMLAFQRYGKVNISIALRKNCRVYLRRNSGIFAYYQKSKSITITLCLTER